MKTDIVETGIVLKIENLKSDKRLRIVGGTYIEFIDSNVTKVTDEEDIKQIRNMSLYC
jgi:hypothetical protein